MTVGQTMIQRKAYIKRSTPVKRKRVEPRRGPLRDVKYRRYLYARKCLMAVLGFSECYKGDSDPAHTQNNGMRSKGPDSSCVPLCRWHHIEYDRDRHRFEIKYAVDMKAQAAKFYKEYLEDVEQVPL